ncbi:MAG: hypothetical protein OET90_11520, partial [Desulfuromonadales bacterium]|nr:hypothetical protein [Desulfuromonadales bacterium]
FASLLPQLQGVAVMIATISLVKILFLSWSAAPTLVILFVAASCGGISYIAYFLLFKIDELQELKELLLSGTDKKNSCEVA